MPLLAGLLALVAVTAGIVGWALATVFSTPQEVLTERPFTTAEVVIGKVGSSITLNTVAEWTPELVGSNQAAGTVTSVDIEPGEEVQAGTVLYSVNLNPVVIAQGDVPAFRQMSTGITGKDVAQLQKLLQGLGFYGGPIDSSFSSEVASAVRNWQDSLGREQTGSVEVGDIVNVPTLPTRVTFDESVLDRGKALAGSEPILSGLPVSPGFVIPITEAQASLVPPGTRVRVAGPAGEQWIGITGEQITGEEGGILVPLKGEGDAPVCADKCASLPVSEATRLRSEVVTVEEVEGLSVPSAALRSSSNGSTVVIDEAGKEHKVDVVSSARGLSILEGVEVGLRVRVPASEG